MMNRMTCFRFLLGLAALAVSGGGAFAASSSDEADSFACAVGNAGANCYVAGASADVGVYFKLEPGWHVYWKNAGDAG